MNEVRSLAVTAALIALAGIALHRAFGSVVDPFTVLVLVTVGRMALASYRQRRAWFRESLAVIRAYEAAGRQQILEAVESTDLRRALATELRRDGTETRDGMTETFPLPDIMRRRATWRYWRNWIGSAAALLIGAFWPGLHAAWRLVWMAAGTGFLVRARRYQRWYVAVGSVIEINPFRISLVWPTGERAAISFADGVRCEDHPEDGIFVVRSGDVAIPVSYNLVGFNRLAALVEEYGASIPAPDAPVG